MRLTKLLERTNITSVLIRTDFLLCPSLDISAPLLGVVAMKERNEAIIIKIFSYKILFSSSMTTAVF